MFWTVRRETSGPRGAFCQRQSERVTVLLRVEQSGRLDDVVDDRPVA